MSTPGRKFRPGTEARAKPRRAGGVSLFGPVAVIISRADFVRAVRHRPAAGAKVKMSEGPSARAFAQAGPSPILTGATDERNPVGVRAESRRGRLQPVGALALGGRRPPRRPLPPRARRADRPDRPAPHAGVAVRP